MFHAISYGWAGPGHPDPERFHLANLAPIIKARLAWVQSCGLHDIAIFWDFPSLYQKKTKAGVVDRTDAQKALFDKGLGAANYWYGHKLSTVWMLTKMPPGTPHDKQYFERGWPYFECALSNILKEPSMCLDLGAIEDPSKVKIYNSHVAAVCMTRRLVPPG